jgi:DNA-binding transcriptional MerR regulator
MLSWHLQAPQNTADQLALWCWGTSPKNGLTLDNTPECMLETVMPSAIQIGEASKRTALSIDTIRFYERQALLPKAIRTEGRFRLYTEDDLARLEFIRQMQDLGFSLREIKQLLDLRSRKTESCSAVRELLTSKLKTVRAKIVDLQTLETELTKDFRKCNQELKRRTRRKPCACPLLEGRHH